MHLSATAVAFVTARNVPDQLTRLSSKFSIRNKDPPPDSTISFVLSVVAEHLKLPKTKETIGGTLQLSQYASQTASLSGSSP